MARPQGSQASTYLAIMKSLVFLAQITHYFTSLLKKLIILRLYSPSQKTIVLTINTNTYTIVAVRVYMENIWLFVGID